MSQVNEIAIYGAGGFAREVAWLLSTSSLIPDDMAGLRPWRVLGYLDDDSTRHGGTVGDLPVLGGMEWVEQHPGIAVAIGIGSPAVKRALADRLREAGATFPPLVAASAQIGDRVSLGEGAIICAGTVLTCDIEIGPFAMLNLNVTIGHDVTIGAYSTLSPGTNISGNVHIGTGCDLGTNVTVIPSAMIGDGTIIGAAACVTKDIPANVTAVGIPAKVIREH